MSTQLTKRGNEYRTNFIKPTKNRLGIEKMRADHSAKVRHKAVFLGPLEMFPVIVENKDWDKCEGLKHLVLTSLASGQLKYNLRATRQVTYFGLNENGKDRLERRRKGWKQPKANPVFK